jgi:transketolase C-terminal domain/subunit
VHIGAICSSPSGTTTTPSRRGGVAVFVEHQRHVSAQEAAYRPDRHAPRSPARTFELGKAKTIRDGNDVLVVYVPTIKPLDEAAILREATRPGRMVVVAENHTVVGGLGEAVAGVLMRAGVMPAGFRQIALPDAFLDAGALPTLHDQYGISAEAVARQIKGWL